MSRPIRLMALGAAVTLLASGCALQDTRYDYSRSVLPFADYQESIIDWNFPTALNQGPLTAPQRLQPWRPAIGVPWAYGDPLAPSPAQAPISDAAPRDAVPHDAPAPCNDACATPAPVGPDADASARLHEPSPARTR